MLDAYTIKKIAPRLLIAAIGINLSIYFCVAAIDITNVVGHALANLLVQPFADAQQLELKPDTGGTTLAGFLLIGSALAGIVVSVMAISGGPIAAIFFTLLPIMLLILAILIVIVIRQALLVLLTIFSPIAIVCLVLPGTEKYFKMWWDLFLKTLLVYPIIAALFALSNIMAIIAFNSSSAGDLSNGASAAQIIGGVVLSFLPLFLVPFAFRFAGGAIGSIMGSTRGFMQGLNRFSGKQRQAALSKGAAYTKSGNFIRGNGRFARGASSFAQSAMLSPNAAFSRRPGAKLRALKDASTWESVAKGMESPIFSMMKRDDDLFRAVAANDSKEGAIRSLMAADPQRWSNRSVAAQAIEQGFEAKKQMGDGAFKIAATRAMAPNSTAFTDHADAASWVAATAGNNEVLAADLWGTIMEGQPGSGRGDVGGGAYSAGIDSVQRARTMMDNNMKTTGDSALTDDQKRELNSDYLKSATGRMGSATLMGGKPTSAKHMKESLLEQYSEVQAALQGKNDGLLDENGKPLPGNYIKAWDPTTDKAVPRKVVPEDQARILAQISSAHEYAKTQGGENLVQASQLMLTKTGGKVDISEVRVDDKGEKQVFKVGERPETIQDRIHTIKKSKGTAEALAFDSFAYQYGSEYSAAEEAERAKRAAEAGKPPEDK